MLLSKDSTTTSSQGLDVNTVASGTLSLSDLSPEDSTGPFEGPEKLLELWFSDTEDQVSSSANGNQGLRGIPRLKWEAMLDEVHCKVLSVIEGHGVDAYLLSESSMFVWPHKLILKTCGTTTLLLGIKTILQLAKDAGFSRGVWRAFYSRKTFMFPDMQKGPHRDWKAEMAVLDGFFKNGSGYSVGPMNGDHWLLYATIPDNAVLSHPSQLHEPLPEASTSASVMDCNLRRLSPPDQTLEILMSDLDPSEAAAFYFPSSEDCASSSAGRRAGLDISHSTGITDLFPTSSESQITIFDAYCFQPCGYSANVTMQSDRYATIHVTPELGWSYASFETNMEFGRVGDGSKLDVKEVVQRLLRIFNPGTWTLTLFVSAGEDDDVQTTGEQGLAALHEAKFVNDSYKRTAKIVYDFDDYELLFSTFSKRRPGSKSGNTTPAG